MVAIALAIEDELVELRELLCRLLRDPRGQGGHLQLVAGQVELKHAEQAVTALVCHLVVLQDTNDIVASIVLIHAVARAVVVAAHGEENLVILLNELVPQPLAVVIGVEDLAGAIDVENLVAGEDDRQVRVGIENTLGPVQGLIVRAPGQRQDQVLLTLGLKNVVLRVVVDRSVAFLEGFRVGGLGALGAEVVVVRVR